MQQELLFRTNHLLLNMRTVLITGTKSGIGLELVKQWLHHRTHCPDILIATVRKISDAKELSALAATNNKLRILELDLNQYEKFDQFAGRVSNIVGNHGLNVLHHNAGVIFSEDTLEDVTEKNLNSQFRINTMAPILLTKALLPLLRKGANCDKPIGVDRGAVIYTSSHLGSISNNHFGKMWGYRESKCAGNMAMTTIKHELSNDGIASLMLHPGWVQTNIGGSEAPLTPEQSASGLINVIVNLNSSTNGKFIQYDGKELLF